MPPFAMRPSIAGARKTTHSVINQSIWSYRMSRNSTGKFYGAAWIAPLMIRLVEDEILRKRMSAAAARKTAAQHGLDHAAAILDQASRRAEGLEPARRKTRRRMA